MCISRRCAPWSVPGRGSAGLQVSVDGVDAEGDLAIEVVAVRKFRPQHAPEPDLALLGAAIGPLTTSRMRPGFLPIRRPIVPARSPPPAFRRRTLEEKRLQGTLSGRVTQNDVFDRFHHDRVVISVETGLCLGAGVGTPLCAAAWRHPCRCAAQAIEARKRRAESRTRHRRNPR